MHYKSRDSSLVQRLNGTWAGEGLPAALHLYRSRHFPKTFRTRAWRAKAFLAEHGKVLLPIAVTIVGWVWFR